MATRSGLGRSDRFDLIEVTESVPLEKFVWDMERPQTMKGKSDTTEQKIRILREAESSMSPQSGASRVSQIGYI